MIQTEPALEWESMVALSIHHAVDGNGQVLQQPGIVLGGEMNLDPAEEVIMVVDDSCEELHNGGQRRVPVTLNLTDKPSGHLRELRGSVSAWVRTKPEPLVTIEGILKAAGTSRRSRDGTLLKVSDVAEKDGMITLKIEVTAAPAISEVNAGATGATRVMMINRGGRGKHLLHDSDRPRLFTLLDDRGQPFRLATGYYTLDRGGQMKLFTLTFQGARTQGPPARLVYTAREQAFIEVPFVLRDVPLQP
jgi:hypothetical protein